MRDHMNTTIPEGMTITRLPTRVARGARHRGIASRGDAPSFYGAARETGRIFAQADRRALLRLAALFHQPQR